MRARDARSHVSDARELPWNGGRLFHERRPYGALLLRDDVWPLGRDDGQPFHDVREFPAWFSPGERHSVSELWEVTEVPMAPSL